MEIKEIMLSVHGNWKLKEKLPSRFWLTEISLLQPYIDSEGRRNRIYNGELAVEAAHVLKHLGLGKWKQ